MKIKRVFNMYRSSRIDDNIDMRSIWMGLNTYVKTLESNIGN